jgi:hypothetical protein
MMRQHCVQTRDGRSDSSILQALSEVCMRLNVPTYLTGVTDQALTVGQVKEI